MLSSSSDWISIAATVLLISNINWTASQKTLPSSYSIEQFPDVFMLDGQPLHIVSGSLHYFRVPAEYWRDRLSKLRAAGLNSVSTYVEWSFHEPEERQYNFQGDRDIVEFIRIAAEIGLLVLLRPGPYICAERDLGGLPYWLLGKYEFIKLRSTDKDFLSETKTWMIKLFEKLYPFLYGNGGPIIMVQIENEYGSYDKDVVYMTKIRNIISSNVRNKALLYTTDGFYFPNGEIPGVLRTVDFGPMKQGAIEIFQELRKLMPSGPLMNSEFYTGWITHWEEPFAQKPSNEIIETLVDMLKNYINVNFYMFCGGTNFEFTAGANYDGYDYLPQITSYDYDAPLSEAGDPTPKYYDIRNTILNIREEEFIPAPLPSPKNNYGNTTVYALFNLLSPEARALIGKKYDDVIGSQLPTFESLRQRSGLMLYETNLEDTVGWLEIKKPRDLIYVYLNGVLKGKISRMQKTFYLPLMTEKNSTLSLLVENQGRVNYGLGIHDRKGILSDVKHNHKVLNNTWTITGFPLERMNFKSSVNLNTAKTTPNTRRGATLYVGQFVIDHDQQIFDTFLNTEGWGKGYIWINGHNLGRYWPSAGPQVTLYVPGVWLRTAPEQNNILILELEKPPLKLNISFIDHPILNKTSSFFINNTQTSFVENTILG